MAEGDADLAVAEATLRWERTQPLNAVVIKFVRGPLHRRLQSGWQTTGEAREACGVVKVGNGNVTRPRGDECAVCLQLTNQVNRLGRLWAEERVIAKDRHLIWLQRCEFCNDRFKGGKVAVNI